MPTPTNPDRRWTNDEVNGPHWNEVLDRLPREASEENGSFLFAEVGVWKGEFHRQILGTMLRRGFLARGFAVDHWNSKFHADNGEIEFWLKTWELIRDGLVCPLKMDSSQAAALFEPFRPFDLVYIDAAHDLTSVRRDIKAWAHLVRPGGLLSGHDYGWTNPRGRECGVRQAVDDFVAASGYTLELGDYATWHIRIPEAATPSEDASSS